MRFSITLLLCLSSLSTCFDVTLLPPQIDICYNRHRQDFVTKEEWALNFMRNLCMTDAGSMRRYFSPKGANPYRMENGQWGAWILERLDEKQELVYYDTMAEVLAFGPNWEVNEEEVLRNLRQYDFDKTTVMDFMNQKKEFFIKYD